MAAREEGSGLGAARVLDADEVEGVLSGAFYAPQPQAARPRKAQPKPAHYKVICISLYNRDLEHLDALVDRAQGARPHEGDAAARSFASRWTSSISTKFPGGFERRPEVGHVRRQRRLDREVRAGRDGVNEVQARGVERVARDLQALEIVVVSSPSAARANADRRDRRACLRPRERRATPGARGSGAAGPFRASSAPTRSDAPTALADLPHVDVRHGVERVRRVADAHLDPER
jgi:hypothetical protein